MSEFTDFVQKATGGQYGPYRYQELLAEHGLPDVLRVPTGSGKTLAATLPWLYRRLAHPDHAIRGSTPRWLVVVLPQRALVEQTTKAIRTWVGNLELDVPVHVLMGGTAADEGAWKSEPDRERIFVGTQDMVLSRLLMRGYAEGRAIWPVSFGLLNAGAQFVFDEVQLMGPGLPTSLQLQGLRDSLGTALPCRSLWMSATLEPDELRTVDFTRPLAVVELGDEDRVGELGRRLNATRTIRRLDLGMPDSKKYPRLLADRVLAEHRPGTRTLVVLNTVERAMQVFDQVSKSEPDARGILLHSRFRPDDRARHTEDALAEPGPAGLIVVTTQVLEAGVDTTSETLITETAPWSSIVQRVGRCNRDGHAEDARLWWTPPPTGKGTHLPYDPEELANTERILTEREGRALTSTELTAAGRDVTRPVHPVLRRRDLLDLFDTAPDLSGNDIDVGPFIRDAADRTVLVAWRAERTDPEAPERAVRREELCPAPVNEIRELAQKDPTRARIYDQYLGEWRNAQSSDVRPTSIIILDAARGGYDPERGFDPTDRTPVESLAPPDTASTAPDQPEAGRWVPLAEHLADTEREAEKLLTALGQGLDLSTAQREAVRLAARYHDLGKAHPTFVDALARANEDRPMPGRVPWAKSPGRAPLRHDPPHFRHELVSALLLLDGTGLIDHIAERDLAAYLALAHHGQVRIAVRGRPDEPQDIVLGVKDGTSTLDAALPGGTMLAARTVSLELTKRGPDSLTTRALRLRDRADLGPFRLAFCEALVRVADWRASALLERRPT